MLCPFQCVQQHLLSVQEPHLIVCVLETDVKFLSTTYNKDSTRL